MLLMQGAPVSCALAFPSFPVTQLNLHYLYHTEPDTLTCYKSKFQEAAEKHPRASLQHRAGAAKISSIHSVLNKLISF